MDYLDTLLDHTTDIIAVLSLAYVALNGAPGAELIAAITTIALGKRYMENKRGEKGEANN